MKAVRILMAVLLLSLTVLSAGTALAGEIIPGPGDGFCRTCDTGWDDGSI